MFPQREDVSRVPLRDSNILYGVQVHAVWAVGTVAVGCQCTRPVFSKVREMAGNQPWEPRRDL